MTDNDTYGESERRNSQAPPNADFYRDLDVAWINEVPLISRVRKPKGVDPYIEILDQASSLRVMWDYIKRLRAANDR